MHCWAHLISIVEGSNETVEPPAALCVLLMLSSNMEISVVTRSDAEMDLPECAQAH